MGLRSGVMLSDYLANLTLSGHRPRTIKARRDVIGAFASHIKPRTLTTATRRDVESYLARPLTASSRHTYLTHLRSFYRWALDEGHVDLDPTAKITPIRVKPGTPRPIAADDLIVALEAADARMRAWLLLMSLAGLRCLEVASLHPQDLILTEGLQPMLFLRECKGGGTAMVPAHPAIVEALSVLPVRDGLWWQQSADNVSTTTGRYMRSLGIEATAHQLRHSAGTSWYRVSGHDLLTTAALLRHARVSSSQIYAQLDPTRPSEVVNLVPCPG